MATKAFKNEKIEAIKEHVAKAKVMIVTEYKGLSVAEITDVRRRLQKEDGDYTVVKNTLAKIAIKDTPFECMSDLLEGPVAIAMGFGDEVSPAKVFTKFMKDSKKGEIKGGAVDGVLLSPKEVEALAKLPSKEELYAKILGSINSPASGIANSVNAVMRSLVYAMDQVRQKKSAQFEQSENNFKNKRRKTNE